MEFQTIFRYETTETKIIEISFLKSYRIKKILSRIHSFIRRRIYRQKSIRIVSILNDFRRQSGQLIYRLCGKLGKKSCIPLTIFSNLDRSTLKRSTCKSATLTPICCAMLLISLHSLSFVDTSLRLSVVGWAFWYNKLLNGDGDTEFCLKIKLPKRKLCE